MPMLLSPPPKKLLLLLLLLLLQQTLHTAVAASQHRLPLDAAPAIARAPVAWSGLWNADAAFKTGLSLVDLAALEIHTVLTEAAGLPASGASSESTVSVARLWGGVVANDTIGAPSSSRISSRLWHPNVYLGVEYDTSFEAKTTVLSHSATALSLSRSVRLATQQGWVNAIEDHTFSVLDGDRLRYTMHIDKPNATAVFEFERPTDSSTLPTKSSVQVTSTSTARALPSRAHQSLVRDSSGSHVDAPADRRKSIRGGVAYSIVLNDTWSIADGGVDNNLLLLSLQGLANRRQHTLYLTYPSTWAYSYTDSVRTWVEETYDLPLTELRSAKDALYALRNIVKGYVVFDPHVRESIMVGLTAAGTFDAALVSPALVPMAKAAGLPCALDLRDQFVGWNSVRIYTWARDKFFDQCSKHVMVWLGGACGDMIHPAVADWGVSQRAFFTDLDTRPDVPSARDEYSLADSLVASLDLSLPTPPLVMGWHSYCKDFEHTFASIASKHGGRVHGLNTNPNLSFMHQLPLPTNFSFHNNRPAALVMPHVSAMAPTSSYVTLVQTDGLGLGAWNKPGRGALPYAWEVTLPDLEIQPALLAMFYSQATANDSFVAALSGPGYVYPKAAGTHLPRLLALAGESMATLDLDVMVVFDASNSTGSSSALGDTTLPENVVAEYSRCLPNATGFLNGYGPSFTASPNNGRAFLSFDYYLDEQRPTIAVADDLVNLAQLNSISPYLLAIHVREYSDVNKVAGILSGLEATQVLPVHEFIALANSHPTYRTRFGPTGPGQTSQQFAE